MTTAERLKGGKLSRQAAMLCQNEKFRRWIDKRRRAVDGTHTADMTREWLIAACKVSSRAEIDHNEYAKKMFHKIVREFMRDTEGAY
jgi:hypothetical protein